jgi:hypothetical protein
MVFPAQSLQRRLAGGAALLALVLLLVACGGGSNGTKSGNANNGTTANPVKQMVPTMVATATHTSMGMATATKTGLTKTYTGAGYTIEYPADWKLTTSSTETAFTDPTGSYNLTIGSTPNPDGAKTSEQLAEGGITGAKVNLKNVETVNVASTTMVGGQEWSQRSISGTSTLNGQSSDVKAVVLANNHPSHNTETKGYVIVYVAAKDKFSDAQTKYFQPMLESFKYTA